jgi:DNA mismatch endonuclease (patch repair protein)
VADMVSAKRRSEIMARIGRRGNLTTEKRMVTFLRSLGLMGWRRHYRIRGTPDFVFVRRRICIFVDGDFWHGNPRVARLPKTNRPYWKAKISRTIARDRAVTRYLRREGWAVLRFWESDLQDAERVTAKLLAYL